MEVKTVTRAFRYNNIPLADPDPTMSTEKVREFYSNIYPEITTAEIEGPENKGNQVVYTFRRAVGTKGGAAEDCVDAAMSAIQMICVERARQIAKGRDAAHDDTHVHGELAKVAAALAVYHTDAHTEDPDGFDSLGDPWKLQQKHCHDEIRRLTIAGALIAAEIDRLQRRRARG